VAARSNAGPRHAHATSGPDPDAENYYELLGVRYSATSTEITRAYREAMKRFHPDRVRPEHRQAAENICKDFNRAYATLSDPVERIAYDRTIRQQEMQDQIMRRYAAGFPGPASGADQHATALRRDITAAERRDHRRSERSAMISLLAVFVIVTVGAIGLILIAGVVSFLVREVF
jgi:DnaJ-class molecular chaperone